MLFIKYGASMENPIFYVEKIVWLLKRGEVEEQAIRRAGELMGMPTKRADVLRARYSEVFSRFVEKRCCNANPQYGVCIYSWNRRKAFKAFPVSIYATGTVILFRSDEPVKVMSNPMPKALDYSEALEHVSPNTVPAYVSARVDGWQVNLYFDELLGRWVFSTRYVLHNMYFVRGSLNIDPYGEISNPIVSLADTIASKQGLYDMVRGYEGWTFIFSLLGPEPAITSPPYPIAPDPSEYSLYLVAARKSDGKLINGAEASKEIGWDRYPEPIDAKSLEGLYNEIRASLNIRSLIAWIPSNIQSEDPMLIEIPSQYYYDAMMVKHLNDAKSALILCSEELCDHLKKIVGGDIAERIERIGKTYRRLYETLSQRAHDPEVVKRILEIMRSIRGSAIDEEEISNELSTGNFKRIAKKILALIFEGKSLASNEIIDLIEMVERIN
ncbi:MAG: hypothetical protein QXQ57_06435, partial [Sulfolobales archaeon]